MSCTLDLSLPLTFYSIFTMISLYSMLKQVGLPKKIRGIKVSIEFLSEKKKHCLKKKVNNS